MEVQHSEFASTQQQISLATTKEDSFMKRLQERDSEVAELSLKLRQISAEVEDLRKRDAVKCHDNDSLISDLQTLTKEN